MKENLITVWETYRDNWNECNVLGKAFQILLTPLWLFFATIITPLEFLAGKLVDLVSAIQKECTKDKYR